MGWYETATGHSAETERIQGDDAKSFEYPARKPKCHLGGRRDEAAVRLEPTLCLEKAVSQLGSLLSYQDPVTGIIQPVEDFWRREKGSSTAKAEKGDVKST